MPQTVSARTFGSLTFFMSDPAKSCRHHAPPFQVSEDGYYRVDAVESGRKGDAFVNVQPATERVDKEPNYPLLDILFGECPKAYDAQRVDKAVAQGDVARREAGKNPVYQQPQQCPCGAAQQETDSRNMRYGKVGLLSVTAEPPTDVAVDGCEQIVNLKAEVGIKPRCIVGIQVHGRHNDAYNPKTNVCAIFKPKVKQAYHGTGNVHNQQTVNIPEL